MARASGTTIYDCAKQVKPLVLPDIKARILSLHPKGRFVAFRNEDSVEIFDIEKRTTKNTDAFIPARRRILGFDAPEDQPFAYSPDGTILAGGEGAQLVVMRDDKLQRLAGHRNTIMSLGFSDDSKWLATGARDGKAIVWDLVKSAKKWEFDPHENLVQHVSISRDGKMLASAGTAEDPTVSLWDLVTGAEMRRWTIDYVRKEGILGTVFSPDGKYLAISQGFSCVEIYETSTGKLHAVAPGHSDTLFPADHELRDIGTGRFVSIETTHRCQVLLWNWDYWDWCGML